jgi:branched-chain amino acid transport system substrate-binding protein
MHRRVIKLVAAAAAIGLIGAVAASTASARQSADVYKVGIVYSRTGLLAAYGAQYLQGLQLGLKYATNGTGMVNGQKVQFTYADDAGDPATAVSAGKDLIGQGYKIIAGSTASGVALQMGALAAQNHVLFISGPAASDSITGLNRYTFRSGRQTYQDIQAAASYLGDSTGKKVVVFAQDSVFGQGNFAAVNAVIGGKGHAVSKILVPLTATDITPFAQQVKQANPNLLFVAWAGTTAGAMWTALDQQGAFDVSDGIVTGLAERATYASYGPALDKIKFLSHYVYNGPSPKNVVNTWLVTQMKKQQHTVPDIFTPDGFVAAQMIVHALTVAKSDDPEKLIPALEGWKFLAPKGLEQIRPSDHALLQPMFRVTLKVSPGPHYTPVVAGTASASATAPPKGTFRG